MITWFLTLCLAILLIVGGTWLLGLLLRSTAYSEGYAAGQRRVQHERNNADYQRGYNMAVYGTEVAPTPYYVTNWPQLTTIDGEVISAD